MRRVTAVLTRPTLTGHNRKALAPRATRPRHQSASRQPKLILKLSGAVPDLRGTADFCSVGFGEAAMKQTVIWLALALLFAVGVTLSFTADSYGPTATTEATAPAPQPAPQMEAPQPVVAASVEPAEPGGPVAMLDDVPPGATAGSDAAARGFVAPGAGLGAEAVVPAVG